MLLQASDDIEQIRRRRIPLRPKHLVQRLNLDPCLLRQRRSKVEQCIEFPLAVHDTQNEHVRTLNLVHNHKFTRRKTSHAGSEITLAGSTA